MTIRDHYVDLAVTTASCRFSANEPWRNPDVFHGVVGLMTEVVELRAAFDPTNLVEEVGDCAWYLALIYHGFGRSKIPAPPDEDVLAMTVPVLMAKLTVIAGSLLDEYKKGMWYQKTVDMSKIRDRATEAWGLLYHLGRCYGFSLETALEANIRKLSKRYPNQFEEKAALIRDLDAERAALEGSDDA